MKIACINKIRNEKGVIVKYILEVEDGSRIEATAKQIKEEMRYNNRYDFINLQIDSIGRLVDKKIIFEREESMEEVYDRFLKTINDKYKSPNGIRDIINDYKGIETSLATVQKFNYVPNEKFCRMTKADYFNFNSYVGVIEVDAKKDKLIAHKYNRNKFKVEFPKQVEEFLIALGFKPYAYENITEALFYLAAEDKGLALVKFGDTREYHDGFDTFTYFEGDMILTSNYDKIKEFITQRGGEDSLTELSTRYTIEGNKLGAEFLERIEAEQ